MENLTGKRFGQYEVVDAIGGGGMGAVYRARDTQLNREVALKVLPPELARDHEFIERFQREANTAASLEHPHIVAIYNIGQQDGMHYLAMRLLHGQTLNHLIRHTGAIPLLRILKIIEQLASALDYAHRRGIIHRDIKPANIMVDTDDYVTLMDFGIARALVGSKITRTGTMIGTPEYMAPEQFTGEDLNVQADTYALSVVLYEMLTGHVPFTGETPVAISHGHVYQPPPPPSSYNPQIPPAVEQVVLRGLAKRPEARYATASALAQALGAAIRGEVQPEVLQSLKLTLPNGAEYALQSGVLRLGRAPDNQIVVNEELVSRYHAEIRSDEHSSAIIDLGSANGTFVNGQQLVPHRPQTLQAGMQIHLGRQTLLTVQAGPVTKVHAVPPVSKQTTMMPSPTQPTRKENAGKKPAIWIGALLGIVGLACIGGAIAGALWLLGEWSIPLTTAPTDTPITLPATTTVAETPTSEPVETPTEDATKEIATPKPTATPTEKPTQKAPLETKEPTQPVKTVPPTTPRPLTTPPAQSPNSRVVYACGEVGNADICLYNTATGKSRVIFGSDRDDSEPDWSPDGKRVAFQSSLDGNYDIFIADATGASAFNLTNTPGRDERHPDWSNDGQQIVYEVGDGVNNGTLWTASADGSGRQQLLARPISGRAPVWSPDNSQIAAMRKENNGYWIIVIISVANGQERKLVHSGEHCRFPTWSPDGRWLSYNTMIFSTSPTGKSYEIWRVRADGSGTPQQVTKSSDNGRPNWSPDGASIIYNHKEYLYTVDIDSGNIAQLDNTLDGWAPDWIW
ncbi:MAG: protein kinase [Anaerolineae bacterium]|nr:protein kinase [Anaerolineae bacterium]